MPLIAMICVLSALSVIGCARPPLSTEVEVTREAPVTREVETVGESLVEIEVTRQVEITREVPVTRLIYMGLTRLLCRSKRALYRSFHGEARSLMVPGTH